MTQPPSSPPHPERRIRSFVRRAGRLTLAQARALETLGPSMVLPYSGKPLDLPVVFGRDAPCVLEIGFGNGEALLAMAQRLPEVNFLGLEVHEPGVGHLLLRLAETQVGNARICCHDAAEVIRDSLPAAGLAAINLFFPDPWPKKRHHKRRLLQAPLVTRLARLQPPGGLLHLATDWVPYAEHMVEVMAPSEDYETLATAEAQAEPLAWRPQTKFERRGLRLGHEVRDLYFRRRG
jgi:tRNA (guanine-N7-)-methyltransferase